jgi:hypothetical protein
MNGSPNLCAQRAKIVSDLDLTEIIRSARRGRLIQIVFNEEVGAALNEELNNRHVPVLGSHVESGYPRPWVGPPKVAF